MHDFDDLMSGLDVPVPIPQELRARLTRALTQDDEPLLAGVDAPHELSSTQRARLTELLLAAPLPIPLRLRTQTRWLAVAAAILLIVGGITATTLRGSTSRRSTAALSAGASGTTTPSAALPVTPAHSAQDATGSASNSSAGASGPQLPATDAPNLSIITNGGAAATSGTPEPPYAFGISPAASMPAAPPGQTPAPPPPSPPAAIAVVGGDRAERDGFNAYLAALSQSSSRQIQVVAPGARGALATVNLSDAALPGGSTIPVLETMAVSESELRSPVYDTASAPAHQAKVAVSAMFPKATKGKVAAVYRGAHGVWNADVATAMTTALRAANVTPVVMTYVAGASFQAIPADVAFLSLDTADAKAWFADAARAHYRPAMGVGGVSSLVDPTLAPALPDGTIAVGAYDLTGNPEQGALASAIHRTPGMAEVHGWVTAKVLAVTLWRSGATTPAQLATALAQLPGYDDGWSPPLAFRPGTTSRTPDGVVFTVRGGAYVTNHAFATDKS